MHVVPSKQIFKCFACGVGGDAIKFLRKRDGLGYREALQQLAQRAGITLSESPEDRRRLAERDELLRVLDWARAHFRRNLTDSPAGRAARDYARRRGLSDETIERFGLGYAAESWDDLWQAGRRAGIEARRLRDAGLVGTAESGKAYDRFRHRLMFPIADHRGRTVAFGGRTLGDDPAKYLNSPETALFSKSRVLYGFDMAEEAIRRQSRVIVVEGYLDAVLLVQHGVDPVVATLGTALTDQHVKLLRPRAAEAVLCFDGDLAGQRAADRAVETAVRHELTVRVAILPDNQDPADFVSAHGREAFERALADAEDALQFKWAQTLNALAQGEYRSRSQAIEAYVSFVATARAHGRVNLLEHGLLVDRLSGVVALPHEQVHELLARAGRDARPQPTPTAATLDIEQSAYALSVAEAPPGLVAAVEDCFGLALADPQCFEQLDEVFHEAVRHCPAWDALLEVMEHLADQGQPTDRSAVLAATDDELVMDAAAAALARVGTSRELEPTLAFALARARLAAELDLIKTGDLTAVVRSADDADVVDQAFVAMVDAARKRSDGFLSPADRWRQQAR